MTTTKNFLWKVNTDLSIEGLENNDRTGNKVSISEDGKIIAIGENGVTTEDGNVHGGRIRVISIEDKAKPKGILLAEGENHQSFMGHALKLSSDGKFLITGEPFFDKNVGKINIYNIAKEECDIIYGEYEKENFGWDVSINKNGDVIAAVSSYFKPSGRNNLDYQGGVKIYRKSLDNVTYEKFCDIKDENFSAQNICMCEDGNVIIITERGYPLGDVNDIKSETTSFDSMFCEGQVRTYKYDSETKSYKNFGGPPISGSDLDAFSSNYSIAISSKGEHFIIGEKSFDNHKGRVRVFKFNNNLEIWESYGVNSEFKGINLCGCSVDIDSTGNHIIFSDDDKVKTYYFDHLHNQWLKGGQDILDEHENSETGSSIALSKNSNILIIGEPTFKEKGRIRFFEKIYAGEENIILADNKFEIKVDNDIASLIRRDSEINSNISLRLDSRNSIATSSVKSVCCLSSISDKEIEITLLKNTGEIIQKKEIPKIESNSFKISECFTSCNIPTVVDNEALNRLLNEIKQKNKRRKNFVILVSVVLFLILLFLFMVQMF